MAPALKYLALLWTASALVVRDGSELKTALANGAPAKLMQTWASREGELDLNDPKIWTQYYNKPEDYHALREIKRKLDPDDLFHSKFTLRPAEN